MGTIKVNLDLAEEVRPMIEWSWDLFCSHFDIPYQLTPLNLSDIRIGSEEDGGSDIRVSDRFIDRVDKGRFHHEELFDGEPLIRCRDGTPDHLGTAFYMVNSLQEWGALPEEHDEWGRFRFQASYQYRYQVLEEDLVSDLFRDLEKKLPSEFKGSDPSEKASQCFLTHDIDRIEQGNLREAAWGIRNLDLPKVLSSSYKQLRGKKEWLNIEEVLALHEKRGLVSCFFWLTEKGKDERGIQNADYDLLQPEFRALLRKVREKGSSNGLHKSTFDKSFEEELQKASEFGPFNRNHYLRFQVPDLYKKLEDSGFLLDTSLGFSGAIGFRNSYGRPFHPYDPRSGKKMRLLEVPLQLMDVNLFNEGEKALEKGTRFLEKHKNGKVITILWHNNYLTNGRFREWKSVYETLLDKMDPLGIGSVGPDELLSSY